MEANTKFSITVSNRELTHILAGLRKFQGELEGRPMDPAEYVIECDHEPLTADEIERLCQQLNCGRGQDDSEQDGISNEKLIELAREQWERDGEIEIDDAPRVSRGDDPGAYVQAWVWVDYPRCEDCDEPVGACICEPEEEDV